MHDEDKNVASGQSLTRRSLLQSLAAAAAAAAREEGSKILESNQEAKSASSAPVIGQLSAYMAAAGTRAIPDDAIEKTKHHVLDTFAAMISGVDLPPGKTAMRFAHAYAGAKVATVVGSDVLCGPMEAALANGMLAHSDETDDSHAPAHA